VKVDRYKKSGVDTQASYIVPPTIVRAATIMESETLENCQVSQVQSILMLLCEMGALNVSH